MNWVDLSLYYATGPRRDDDPTEVQNWGVVLWGEGAVYPPQPGQKPSLRRTNLGNGIQLVKVTNTLDIVRDTLTNPNWDYVVSSTPRRVHRFRMGLIERPPFWLCPFPPCPDPGAVHLPVSRSTLAYQFARVDKDVILSDLTGSPEPTRQARETATKVLTAFRDKVEVDLIDTSCVQLGDVVLCDQSALTPPPIVWNAISDPQRRECLACETVVQPELVQAEDLSISITVLGRDNAPIEDRLVFWRRGDAATFRIDASEQIAGARLKAWVGGVPCWEYRFFLLLSIHTNIVLTGPTHSVSDRLTELVDGWTRTRPAEADLARRTKTVSTHSKPALVKSGAAREPWYRPLQPTQEAVFAWARPPVPPTGYFSADPSGRARATMQIADKVSKAGRAWLLDPFFDQVGAETLLPRIPNEVKLTVVTSLPNDDERLYDQLLAYLNAVGHLVIPRGVKILRATKSVGREQAFHDRYLILDPGGRRPTGYMLSNSLSGASRQYPLVIADLPLGTTSAILDYIEGMLAGDDGTQIASIWGSETHAKRRPRLLSQEHLYFGPYWRLYLSCILKRGRRSEEAWLSDAAARGYAVLRDGGVKWITSDTARSQMLDRLFPLPRRRTHQRAVRRSRKRRLSQPGLPERVMAVGERAARGLQIDAETIAARVPLGYAGGLRTYLERTFRLPADPTTASSDVSYEVMALRQLIGAVTPSADVVRAGLATWGDTALRYRVSSRDYGRQFVYAVLALISPRTAVGVGETLRDPELLFGCVSWPDGPLARWPHRLSEAFLRARSPFLRAIGAQSWATPDDRGNFETHPLIPDALDGVKHVISCEEVPADDRAWYATLWGDARMQNPQVRRYLACRLVDLLPFSTSQPELARQIVDGPCDFFDAVVSAAAWAESASGDLVLELLSAIFARRCDPSLEPSTRYFDGDEDMERVAVVGFAVAVLAWRRTEDVQKLVHRLSDRESLITACEPLSRFRHRKGYRQSLACLGWSILWEISALTDATGMPSAAVCDEARHYVTEWSDAEPGLAKAITQVLASISV